MILKKQSIFILLLFCLILSSCATVPITGRKQLNLIPTSSMMSTSFQQYDKFLKEHELSDNKKQTEMVQRVGKKIKKSVEKYMAEKNMSEQLKNYEWEFNLVESEQINAWCMPGGKVVIYTGIMEVARDETGLAVIMGHEIAHAVAEHGNERMSQGLMTQLGGLALAKAIEQKPEQTQQLWMAAFGVGSQLGYMLPYSRLHESEADHLGLIFMALAGYNPREAVDFWQRMSKMKEGQSPPEFISTHPSDEERIKNLKKLMPKALKYYKES